MKPVHVYANLSYLQCFLPAAPVCSSLYFQNSFDLYLFNTGMLCKLREVALFYVEVDAMITSYRGSGQTRRVFRNIQQFVVCFRYRMILDEFFSCFSARRYVRKSMRQKITIVLIKFPAPFKGILIVFAEIFILSGRRKQPKFHTAAFRTDREMRTQAKLPLCGQIV